MELLLHKCGKWKVVELQFIWYYSFRVEAIKHRAIGMSYYRMVYVRYTVLSIKLANDIAAVIYEKPNLSNAW